MSKPEIHDGVVVNTSKEWSDAELYQLGEMLLHNAGIDEITLFSRRSRSEVLGKVIEIGRACKPR